MVCTCDESKGSRPSNDHYLWKGLFFFGWTHLVAYCITANWSAPISVRTLLFFAWWIGQSKTRVQLICISSFSHFQWLYDGTIRFKNSPAVFCWNLSVYVNHHVAHPATFQNVLQLIDTSAWWSRIIVVLTISERINRWIILICANSFQVHFWWTPINLPLQLN